mmetsp:Transcript_13609/g.23922  ORF Transcript_13609/g.23922 Transcript_13609/m.23922 type:complete len:210 (-) Transcript_13609:165-794(-)
MPEQAECDTLLLTLIDRLCQLLGRKYVDAHRRAMLATRQVHHLRYSMSHPHSQAKYQSHLSKSGLPVCGRSKCPHTKILTKDLQAVYQVTKLPSPTCHQHHTKHNTGVTYDEDNIDQSMTAQVSGIGDHDRLCTVSLQHPRSSLQQFITTPFTNSQKPRLSLQQSVSSPSTTFACNRLCEQQRRASQTDTDSVTSQSPAAFPIITSLIS